MRYRLTCGCCRGPENDRCCCHVHQDISRGLRAHKCSECSAPSRPEATAHIERLIAKAETGEDWAEICRLEANDGLPVNCVVCGSEGRVLVGPANDPHPRDAGPCPACDGTGTEIVEVQPIDENDCDNDPVQL